MDLTGKSVIVTGSSKGSATPSLARCRPGARMVINSVSSGDAGEKRAAEMGACTCSAMSAGPCGRSSMPPSSGGRVWTVSSTTPASPCRTLAAVEALTVDHWKTVLTTSGKELPTWRARRSGDVDDPSLARRREGRPQPPHRAARPVRRSAGPDERRCPGLVDTPVTETWAARYATGQVLLVGGGLGLLR